MPRLSAAFVLLLALAGPAAAQPFGDAESGRRLAETWCSACHMIGPRASGPVNDAVPSFPAIAAMPSTTDMSLRVFLTATHSRMPNMQLSRAEADDLITYILSLRDR
ncbi:MAG: cytochrome c [Rhodovarius sp.]|nr:cytochrome c [Rhodovarius sp.]